MDTLCFLHSGFICWVAPRGQQPALHQRRARRRRYWIFINEGGILDASVQMGKGSSETAAGLLIFFGTSLYPGFQLPEILLLLSSKFVLTIGSAELVRP